MSTTQKLAATSALETLHDAGFEAYVVGGAVRDLLLGRKAKDYDVTTNARPEQVQALFEKTIPVGAAFGVVVAVINGAQIEIATYRTDGDYGDSRRPNEVFYSNSVESDVTRRDFTINGLLMGEYDTVVDHVGGLTDLEAKVIRAIGDPDARFTEDALRMLRAVRFSAQLGFEIEHETKMAIIHLGYTISKVSRERVKAELEKMLVADSAARGIALLFSTGLARHLFQHVDDFNVREILGRFERFHVRTPTTALAMFLTSFHGSGDDEAGKGDFYLEEILESLKLSNNEYDEIKGALYGIRDVRFAHTGSLADLKRFARKPGAYTAALLMEQDMCLADTQSSAIQASIQKLRSFSHDDLYPRPLVTGDDLLALGYRPGKLFGAILKAVETQQLNGEINTHEAALKAVKSFDLDYCVGGGN